MEKVKRQVERKKAKGFTLIELILIIVISSHTLSGSTCSYAASTLYTCTKAATIANP